MVSSFHRPVHRPRRENRRRTGEYPLCFSVAVKADAPPGASHGGIRLQRFHHLGQISDGLRHVGEDEPVQLVQHLHQRVRPVLQFPVPTSSGPPVWLRRPGRRGPPDARPFVPTPPSLEIGKAGR